MQFSLCHRNATYGRNSGCYASTIVVAMVGGHEEGCGGGRVGVRGRASGCGNDWQGSSDLDTQKEHNRPEVGVIDCVLGRRKWTVVDPSSLSTSS